MWSAIAIISSVWVVVAICRFFSHAPQPQIKVLRHALTDRESLIVVTHGEQFWVWTFRRDNDQQTLEPDWYQQFTRGRN